MEIGEVEVVGCLEYISLKVYIFYFVDLEDLLLADLFEGEDVPIKVHKGDRAVRAAPKVPDRHKIVTREIFEGNRFASLL